MDSNEQVISDLKKKIADKRKELDLHEAKTQAIKDDIDALSRVYDLYSKDANMIDFTSDIKEKQPDYVIVKGFLEEHPTTLFSRGEIIAQLNGKGKHVNVGRSLRYLRENKIVECIGSTRNAKWRYKK